MMFADCVQLFSCEISLRIVATYPGLLAIYSINAVTNGVMMLYCTNAYASYTDR